MATLDNPDPSAGLLAGMVRDLTAADRLLSVDDVADRLGVSAVTVRRMLVRGELAATSVNGRYRVDPRSLADYIAKHRNINPGA